uniref:Cyclic nucleotide-binding domain-containing protein n=1 Tax=Lutzomyia longipalpis TaxID=7200 RepID=A0A1B0CL52_LUTLO
MPSGTFIDHQFIDALCCDPDKRTLQDLQLIYYGLRSLEPLSNLRDSVLRSLCKVVRYERHNVNEILYYTGELSTCWYILLSGAVFINGSMFLPGSSTGELSTCWYILLSGAVFINGSMFLPGSR